MRTCIHHERIVGDVNLHVEECKYPKEELMDENGALLVGVATSELN